MLLSESLGNINCRTTMIAHISDSPNSYMETLTTVQLASRIHRMRKKKSKVCQVYVFLALYTSVLLKFDELVAVKKREMNTFEGVLTCV